ncbi:unnamed protein product [Penicillium salamii]|nr:unnamed protein product [Penicillium salamii]CAG8391710.1 unnamed protein product [Penicillium salamii]
MTTLAELPPELLLILSDFLPLVDLCCFSVCNRRHYCLLSWKMNPRLPLTPNQKLLVSTRLARDTPSYFACTRCKLLHRYDGSESFGLSGYARERACRLPCVQPHPSPKTWFSTADTLVFHRSNSICIKELSFLHLQLAMRRFYYGPGCGISTDSLSHTQVFEHSVRATANKVTWLFSREAQICTKPLGLYLRLQDILLSPEWRDLINMVDGNMNPLAICTHDNMLVRQAVIPLLWSFENKEKDISNDLGFKVFFYVFNTICEIEFCEIDGKKALVKTKWLNLGPGLDERDMRWKTHTNSYYETIFYLGFDRDYPVDEQCPKTRFEKTATQSLEDLRHRNISYLKDKQYETVMRYAWGRGTWYDPFREPSTNTVANFGRSLQAFFGWFPNPAFN